MRASGVAELVDERSIEGSWMLDARGRTLSISEAAAGMLGYDPSELEGRPVLELVDAEDAACLKAALGRRRNGARESYEIRWRHRDGDVVWASMAAAPMTGSDGEFAGSFALVTDVTGRRRADEQRAAGDADRVRLERDLRHALARGELFVVHQPIVAVGGSRVIGTEALVRWRHPERGVVSPADFIGVAEELGLIADLGLWVLRQACTDVAARQQAGHSSLTCHVNLSPAQAADPALPERIAEVLRDTGLPPETLVLELTESSLMEAGQGPLCVMQGIRELGVRLVLDDFGTGYSSLARLRHFPVDGLKIDRSFIADLDSGEPAGALLVSRIVELARALGLTVVAEGVETTAQLERLQRIGCRYAQGFLIARPGDLAQLDELLSV